MKHARSNGKKHRVLKGVLIALAALVVAAAIGLRIYAAGSYHATSEAIAAKASTADVDVTTASTGDMLFLPAGTSAANAPAAAFVFYPGGLVDADAYAPLLQRLAEKNVACVLVRMPDNLAVLAPNRATRGRKELGDALGETGCDTSGVSWMIGGHSLGGAMAASYVAHHVDDYEGLVLLAAYSTADISQSGLKILSLTGSEDGVVNRESQQQDLENLPADARILTIEGGIHSYFGSYGLQDGDGAPQISNDEQLDEAAEDIAEFAATL